MIIVFLSQFFFFLNNTTSLSETSLKWKLTVMNFKCTVIVSCQVNRNGKSKTSMCHHANAHCTCPYVTLNNLHVVAGENKGRAAKTEPIPNLSQSSHSCRLHFQTTHVPHEAHLAALALICYFFIFHSGWGKQSWVQLSTAFPTSRFPCGRYRVWPIHPLHPIIVLGHYFDLILLIFWWLICDFWYWNVPSVL